MRNYWTEVAAYTKGRGRLSCTPDGYAPRHNAEEVISAAYDPTADVENTPDSVFCLHGAGYAVGRGMKCRSTRMRIKRLNLRKKSWNKSVRCVPAQAAETASAAMRNCGPCLNAPTVQSKTAALKPSSRAVKRPRRSSSCTSPASVRTIICPDGYNNIIFSWDELADIAARDVNAAREALVNAGAIIRACAGVIFILVFDAHKVKGGTGSIEQRGGIHIVYTKGGRNLGYVH